MKKSGVGALRKTFEVAGFTMLQPNVIKVCYCSIALSWVHYVVENVDSRITLFLHVVCFRYGACLKVLI